VDSLTHAFAGVAVAHAISREPPTPHTVAAAVVAANIADIDWWTVSRSMSAYFEMHRGISHSLWALPVLAGAVAFGFHLGARRASGGRQPTVGLPWLACVCLVAAATHLVLDGLNPYGLRPFLPFEPTWYYSDLAAIPDPWLWLALGGTALLLTARGANTTRLWAGLGGVITFGALRAIPLEGTFGVVAGLVWVAAAALVLGCWIRGTAQSVRRPVAVVGLAVAATYIASLSLVHHYAVGKTQDTARGLAGEAGEQIIRVAAIPTIGDLSTWRGLVETDRSIYRFPVRLSDEAAVQTERFATLQAVRTDSPPAVWSDPSIRAFLTFARFVAGSVEQDHGQRVILLADLRFDIARPGQPGTWPVHRAIGDR
jgi:membrane-bound metal-dependent hydrolase YbcI (DUF457 family)